MKPVLQYAFAGPKKRTLGFRGLGFRVWGFRGLGFIRAFWYMNPSPRQALRFRRFGPLRAGVGFRGSQQDNVQQAAKPL